MLLLERHPNWSYADLQATPQVVLDVELELIEARAERKARRKV